MTFRALVIEKGEEGQSSSVQNLSLDSLPEGNVTVQISHSTVNYKDSLAVTGSAPVVRNFPMVPGIDFAGNVSESSHPDFAAGDAVILNGWGIGEKHWGGLAGVARVNGDWLIKRPTAISARQSMAIGTAGYTAALCVLALEQNGAKPVDGPVLVTGATGGVGVYAIALLAKAGFEVIASTGKPDEADHLRALGAAQILDRKELSEPGRALGKERWAAAIDAVGGVTLANVCAQTNYGGVVAACGMAQSLDFPASVAPFILRGITLAGVDSVMCPKSKREQAWARLASDLDWTAIDAMIAEIGLSDVPDFAAKQLQSSVAGRVVVDVAR